MFGEPRALPRGPHRLPREQVVASQRNRLLAATTAIVAEHGYSAATIAEISSRAGVSPKTFYEHFADKLDCFLAGYEVLVTTLVARMGASVTSDSSWPQFIASSLDAYLATLEDEPTAARAFVVEIEAAGPRARARRRAAYQQFADLLKGRHQAMRARDCALAALPDRVYLAIAHGVRELVRDALEAHAAPPLRAMAPDVLFWITAAVHGAALASSELDGEEDGQRTHAA